MHRSIRLRGLIVWIVLLGVALGGLLYRQQIIDWWKLRDYVPTAEVARIADVSAVTPKARKIFYVAHPVIEDKKSFNQHCNLKAEKSIILGCYDGQTIYIYNVTDPRLTGVKEVTAMHEMLHAAYGRLSGSERTTLNVQLRQQLAKITEQRIHDLVAQYEKTEPGEVDNELHSILGTEVSQLSPELESYYSRYFTKRQAIVDLAEQYEGVFTASETQITKIDAQLDALRRKIETQEATLEQRRTALSEEQTRLQQLREANQVAAYNNAVDVYNVNVGRFNALLVSTKELVAQHNNLVATRNQLATAHNDLAESLDSKMAPLPAN